MTILSKPGKEVIEMAATVALTAEYARECFDYDPEAGKVTWMCKKLGVKGRKLRGIYREGENARTDLIDPEFYGVLKEEGFRTDRRIDGTYYDAGAQSRWAEYQRAK